MGLITLSLFAVTLLARPVDKSVDTWKRTAQCLGCADEPEAWQYRLRHLGKVVAEDHRAVAVNGSLFAPTPRWRPRLPRDFARGVETTVANHVVSHVWEHTYLLWFDDRLMPTLPQSKPPSQ